jgi:putative addiction module component (TIGR02574 family)
MTAINPKLLDEVLALPNDLRTALIERLIESLNLPLQKEIDRLWAEEADRRVHDLKSGEIHAFSGEDVFEAMRNRYH